MENRRQDYRCPLPTLDRLQAEFINSGNRWAGKVVDLSLEGLGAVFTGDAPPLSPTDIVEIQLSLGEGPPVQVRANLAHGRQAGAPHFGFRFRPLTDPVTQEARRRQLWSFLLEQQRRLRRDRLHQGSLGTLPA